MQRSDEEIIIEYLNGNKNSFTEIVNRYLKSIYNFSYRLIGNEKAAEDIAQEVFLKVWKNIKKFDLEKSFKTWIFSIAKNTCIDYLRKRKDVPISMFDSEDGGNVIEDNLVDVELKADELFALAQDKKEVEKMMTGLTISQKEVIIMKYMNEMSLSEIAEIMKIPVDTAKSHHRRALIKMKRLLNDSIKVIENFQGEYRFLSNYWPVQVEYEGMIYPSVEQAYKSAKTLKNDARVRITKLIPNKKDLPDQIEEILAESGVRKDWTDEMRLMIMKDLLIQKFDGGNEDLQEKLLATKDAKLIEGNDWGDTFFGVCNGVGKNHLGRLLMEVREQIKWKRENISKKLKENSLVHPNY